MSQLTFGEKKEKLGREMEVHLPAEQDLNLLNQDYPAPNKTIKPVKYARADARIRLAKTRSNDSSKNALLGELESNFRDGQITSPKPARNDPPRQAHRQAIVYEDINPQVEVQVSYSQPKPAPAPAPAPSASASASYSYNATPVIPEVSVVPQPAFTI